VWLLMKFFLGFCVTCRFVGSNTRLATKLGLYFEVVIRAGFMGRHLRSEGLSDSLLENLEGVFFVCVAKGDSTGGSCLLLLSI
jgi:hypothetical protein